ncbi:MAG TPA: hypothetical protein ENK57_13755 [Polyangiaceae bacterium]|nr:hypothetical protein [Polyangiaceae bacterium]
MEPLYAALSFAAVALVLIQLGRLLVERRAGGRVQRRAMARIEPIRTADERTVSDLEEAYGIAVSTETPVYEIVGRVETTAEGHVVGGVRIATESAGALSKAGIALEDESTPDDGDGAASPMATSGDDAVIDRFAGGAGGERHVELCFADGDDPTSAPGFVISLDGRRVI